MQYPITENEHSWKWIYENEIREHCKLMSNNKTFEYFEACIIKSIANAEHNQYATMYTFKPNV